MRLIIFLRHTHVPAYSRQRRRPLYSWIFFLFPLQIRDATRGCAISSDFIFDLENDLSLCDIELVRPVLSPCILEPSVENNHLLSVSVVDLCHDLVVDRIRRWWGMVSSAAACRLLLDCIAAFPSPQSMCRTQRSESRVRTAARASSCVRFGMEHT